MKVNTNRRIPAVRLYTFISEVTPSDVKQQSLTMTPILMLLTKFCVLYKNVPLGTVHLTSSGGMAFPETDSFSSQIIYFLHLLCRDNFFYKIRRQLL